MIYSSIDIITLLIALETLEEEQRRKHEVALSRVMTLEQEVVTEREASLAHIEEAKQVKVIILIFVPLLLSLVNRFPWKP